MMTFGGLIGCSLLTVDIQQIFHVEVALIVKYFQIFITIPTK